MDPYTIYARKTANQTRWYVNTVNRSGDTTTWNTRLSELCLKVTCAAKWRLGDRVDTSHILVNLLADCTASFCLSGSIALGGHSGSWRSELPLIDRGPSSVNGHYCGALVLMMVTLFWQYGVLSTTLKIIRVVIRTCLVALSKKQEICDECQSTQKARPVSWLFHKTHAHV